MNYAESVGFITSLTDYEKSSVVLSSPENYDLRRVYLLLGELDNPQLGRKTVHIAGTKGKGSTACMTASILRAAGYHTGLFTSPHLHSWRERIKIDCEDISEDDFARLASLIKPHVVSINAEAAFGWLTTFEVLTALAFLYFKEQNVAFQVLETGLGGRLDATNVINPDVCVLTSISLDHTQVLGRTLKLITHEKAGIIKAGSTVISAPQRREVAEVIRQKCRDLAINLIQLSKDVRWKSTGHNLTGQCLIVQGKLGKYELVIHLLGEHQLENTAMAVAAIEALISRGTAIPRDAIANGLESVNWPARLQILHTQPLVVIDGAHNTDSVNKLIRAVKTFFTYDKIYIIFGSSADKDIDGMAKPLSRLSKNITITRSMHARAAGTEKLKEIFAKQRVVVNVEEDMGAALKNLLSRVGSGDMILVAGSIFLAADAETEFKRISG